MNLPAENRTTSSDYKVSGISDAPVSAPKKTSLGVDSFDLSDFDLDEFASLGDSHVDALLGKDDTVVPADFEDAKKTYHSGIVKMGARMDKVGVEVFGQWSAKRTKDMSGGEKLKTRVNAYGIDLYGYHLNDNHTKSYKKEFEKRGDFDFTIGNIVGRLANL